MQPAAAKTAGSCQHMGERGRRCPGCRPGHHDAAASLAPEEAALARQVLRWVLARAWLAADGERALGRLLPLLPLLLLLLLWARLLAEEGRSLGGCLQARLEGHAIWSWSWACPSSSSMQKASAAQQPAHSERLACLTTDFLTHAPWRADSCTLGEAPASPLLNRHYLEQLDRRDREAAAGGAGWSTAVAAGAPLRLLQWLSQASAPGWALAELCA